MSVVTIRQRDSSFCVQLKLRILQLLAEFLRNQENCINLHMTNLSISLPSILSTFLSKSNQSQSYITTDGQSASPSWYQASIWDTSLIFPFLSLVILDSCMFVGVGRPRGRVCNLQCNDSSSSYIATDDLSASLSWCRAPMIRF
jgi:hypothetical protein